MRELDNPSPLQNYAQLHSTPEPDPLPDLVTATRSRMLYPQMLTGHLEGRLLKLLVQLMNARYVLEVGTFTGHATLCMAEGLPEEGRLLTCEMDPEAIAMAQKFFNQSPHGRKITILPGPALETIPTLKPGFDLAFLDADKREYGSYYELILPRLKPGGLLCVDNALWYGKVINPQDKDTVAIDALNKRVREDPRVESVLLPIADGLHLVRKKEMCP